MNWAIIIPVGIVVLALIVFIIWKNAKDEKVLENSIKNDYRKTKDEEGDVEIEDTHT
jgi:hypothetical protein